MFMNRLPVQNGNRNENDESTTATTKTRNGVGGLTVQLRLEPQEVFFTSFFLVH